MKAMSMAVGSFGVHVPGADQSPLAAEFTSAALATWAKVATVLHAATTAAIRMNFFISAS
jgi:hypothetical protein